MVLIARLSSLPAVLTNAVPTAAIVIINVEWSTFFEGHAKGSPDHPAMAVLPLGVTFVLLCVHFKYTCKKLALALFKLPNAEQHEVVARWRRMPNIVFDEIAEEVDPNDNSYMREAKKIYNKYVPDKDLEDLEEAELVEKTCWVKFTDRVLLRQDWIDKRHRYIQAAIGVVVRLPLLPWLCLHRSVTRHAESADLPDWKQAPLKVWLNHRDVDYEGWVNKSDLEDHVIDYRGTAPNWVHLLKLCLPPKQKRETILGWCLRSMRVKRAFMMHRALVAQLALVVKKKEIYEDCGAAVEVQNGVYEAQQKVYDAAAAVLKGIADELAASTQRIDDFKADMEANKVEKGQISERQEMLGESRETLMISTALSCCVAV